MPALSMMQHDKQDHLCHKSQIVKLDPSIIIKLLGVQYQVRLRVLLVQPPAQIVLSAAVQG
jgi:hypothetical protein